MDMKLNKRTCITAAMAAAALVTATAPVFGQGSYVDPWVIQKRAAGAAVQREGDVQLGATFRTDERYNKPGMITGPRGWIYWNLLPDPKNYQNPNLWPDKRPTYLFGEMAFPAGATLTIRGRFPYVRFFNVSVYLFEHSTFVNAPDGSRDGYDIEPDPGSSNPYRTGADRQAKDRNFTLQIVAADEPANAADRAQNSIYIGKDGKTVFFAVRMYVSDRGYDGTGWGPADTPSAEGPGITYEARLADGTRLSQEEVDKRLGRPTGSAPPPISVDEWYKLVNNKDNDPCMTPATAPACPDTQFRLFTGMEDALEGAFMTPAERAKIPVPKLLGGGANATTAYLYNYTSRKFGPVYVFRGKLPAFPNTWANAKVMPEGQVQYWSVATMAAASSGSLWDGVFDMQVPVDQDGYYTIVVSLPEDRPKNATRENGVAWIDWGPGEGLNDPRNRKDWGMLLMRFMVPSKDWANSPLKSKGPDDLASVMGPYYPRGYYTTKADFEREGPRKVASSAGK
jgi:hypothetical protein